METPATQSRLHGSQCLQKRNCPKIADDSAAKSADNGWALQAPAFTV